LLDHSTTIDSAPNPTQRTEVYAVIFFILSSSAFLLPGLLDKCVACLCCC